MPGRPLRLPSTAYVRRPTARRPGLAATQGVISPPSRSIGLPLALIAMTTALVLAAALGRMDADRTTDPEDRGFAAGQAVLAAPDTLGCVLKAETLWRHARDDTPGAEAQRRFMEINPKTCHLVEGGGFVLRQSMGDHVTEVAASPDAASGVWVPTDTLRPAAPRP